MGNIIGWDETTPSDTESAGLGDDRIRSLKTSLRQGLSAEHTWPSGGGDSGTHLLGSARAYVGTQSQVSSSGTDGRLMWASDSSRLFHVGSGGTVYLGGPVGISLAPGYVSYPQRYHWVEEFGTGITGSSGLTTITFPNSGFSGAPFVFVTPTDPSFIPAMWVQTVTGSSAVAVAYYAGPNSVLSSQTFNWRSIGTRAL